MRAERREDHRAEFFSRSSIFFFKRATVASRLLSSVRFKKTSKERREIRQMTHVRPKNTIWFPRLHSRIDGRIAPIKIEIILMSAKSKKIQLQRCHRSLKESLLGELRKCWPTNLRAELYLNALWLHLQKLQRNKWRSSKGVARKSKTERYGNSLWMELQQDHTD